MFMDSFTINDVYGRTFTISYEYLTHYKHATQPEIQQFLQQSQSNIQPSSFKFKEKFKTKFKEKLSTKVL
jgi:hypothetical protein